MSTEPIQSTKPQADSRGMTLTQQVADRIKEWLDGPRPSWALVDWLEGYNLPAVGPDEDPYIWLRRGLNELSDGLQKEFVVHLCHFIDERPDVDRPGDRPDEVLSNLLWLCARLCLKDRSLLGPALVRMYERAKRGEGLKGETFRGLDLRDPLLLALIANQHDRSLVPIWFRMLRSERDQVLPGTEYSGFYGVLAADLPGQPNLDDLGRALSEIVNYLTSRRGIRLKKLDDLFRRIKEYHGSRASWDVDLIEIADRNKWRLWAVDWLPRIWIGPLDPANASGAPYAGRWLVWAPLWRHLYAYARGTDQGAKFMAYLAGRRIVSCSLDPEVQEFGAKIGPVFEKVRRDSRTTGNERDERSFSASRPSSSSLRA
jgi:hypothetical protein